MLCEAAEAPRCASAIAYNCSGERATVTGSIAAPASCYAARPRTRHGQKKKKHGAQIALQAARKRGRKGKKTRRQPLIRAPAYLLARWVLGHEDCDGSTSGYGEGRCAQGKKRNGGGTARADTIGQYFYLFFQLNACQRPRRRCLPHHERFRPPDLLACWERAPI